MTLLPTFFSLMCVSHHFLHLLSFMKNT
jgi:hypothetical protein